jgi:iron complex outermembrane receptor protein
LKLQTITRGRRCALIAGAALCALHGGAAQADVTSSVEDLTDLSIEELAQLEVVSASKQAEPVSQAPTAIFVITGEDIARSAATSLPEVLRMAPNLHVQRLDAREYAIGARGFTGFETSNKLLVLIDGRTVYTPLHSGVFWEQHAPLLEDLQQIEVISGPGGTLYGPNAVNGVISVVSKDARETLGGLVRGTVGGNDRSLGLRLGSAVGNDSAVRVYANGFERDGMPPLAGASREDGDFTGWQAGFRADWGKAADHFTLQGDVYDNDIDLLPGDGNKGHNLLARWTREFGDKSSFRLQAYYDDFQRGYLLVDDRLETFDVEAQYNRTKGSHALVIGGGLRTTRDLFDNDLNSFVLDPESRRLWVANVFAQDRFAVTPDLDVIAGIKLEHSSFSGLELLPNLRIAWHPSERTLLWSAVSRAVRTPSRIDRQLVSLPLLAQATEFQSEKLIAFEAGYRGQPGPRTTLSVSLFYNLYDDIRTTEFTGNPLPIRLANSLKGETYGVEAWATQQVAPWWRLSLGASALGKDFRLKNGAIDLANRASLGSDPDYQAIARSSMDLGERVQLDVSVRGLDDLEETGIGGYMEADARIAWRILDDVELYVAGQNLLHRTHLESNDPGRAFSIERSIYGGTRVRF